MIAVMGAAGNVGSKVVDLLLGAGEKIRVLAHERDLTALGAKGAEIVIGDARSAEVLSTLFAGADAALVLLPEDLSDPDFVANRAIMSRAIRTALGAERVAHTVVLSTVGAGRPDAPGPPGGLHRFEQDLGTLEATNILVLRSAAYMDYLLSALPMVRAEKVNGSATRGDVAFPMVATTDVAAEAAERLVNKDFRGFEVRLLLGPEDVTMAEATRLLGEHLGMPGLPYVQFPPERVRAALTEAGMSPEVAGLLVDMQLAIDQGIYLKDVERTPESSTATTLADFLEVTLSVVPAEQEVTG